MSEAGEGEAGGEKMTSRKRKGEKNRDRSHGIRDVLF